MQKLLLKIYVRCLHFSLRYKMLKYTGLSLLFCSDRRAMNLHSSDTNTKHTILLFLSYHEADTQVC